MSGCCGEEEEEVLGCRHACGCVLCVGWWLDVWGAGGGLGVLSVLEC